MKYENKMDLPKECFFSVNLLTKLYSIQNLVSNDLIAHCKHKYHVYQHGLKEVTYISFDMDLRTCTKQSEFLIDRISE